MSAPNDPNRRSRVVWLVLTALGAILSIVGWTKWAVAQPVAMTRPAVPLEPVRAMLDAFGSHAIVAVTAGHGDERGYAFGLSLVRDPRFATFVNDIVIEEGSARYQDVADQFVAGGEVPIE